mgnify:CR=1 FL=1
MNYLCNEIKFQVNKKKLKKWVDKVLKTVYNMNIVNKNYGGIILWKKYYLFVHRECQVL